MLPEDQGQGRDGGAKYLRLLEEGLFGLVRRPGSYSGNGAPEWKQLSTISTHCRPSKGRLGNISWMGGLVPNQEWTSPQNFISDCGDGIS
jgi:hypothetical protein